MKQIQITPAELRSQAAEMTSLRAEYERLFSDLDTVLNRANDAWSENLSRNFVGKITTTKKSCSSILEALDWGINAANKSADSFESVDNSAAVKLNGGETGTTDSAGSVSSEAGVNERGLKQFWNNVWGGGITGAVISGAVSGATKFLGIDTEGTAKGDLIGGSVKGKTSAKWDTKNGDAGATAEVSASGHIAEGSLSGNFGYLNGNVKADIGTAVVAGTIGATLFKDGKFSPKAEAKVKGSAVGASGEVNVSVGTEENNAHAKASGELGKAEASAGVGIGMVSTKNAEGEEKTAFGVEANAGAEAYVASGKVSGGITIFGVKIDASVEGKAGGAGVKAGGSITTNGVSGSVGVGLGIGAGLSISVDWSEFSLFGKKK